MHPKSSTVEGVGNVVPRINFIRGSTHICRDASNFPCFRPKIRAVEVSKH